MKAIRMFAATVLALSSSAIAGTSTADFNTSSSLKGLGSFTASETYNSATEQLTVRLTDTSSRGALTSFALKSPAGDTETFVRPAASKWKDDRTSKLIVKARPYGTYGGGAGVGGHWASTRTRFGLAAGQTQSFVFDIAGPTAPTLSIANFLGGSALPDLVATFSGFKHGRTDRAKAWGAIVIPTRTSYVAPSSPAYVPPVKLPGFVLPPPNTPPVNFPTPPQQGGGSVAVPVGPVLPVSLVMLAALSAKRMARGVRRVLA